MADSMKGGIISWGSPCRLKHLGTGLYLSLTQGNNSEEYFINLTSQLTPATLFLFQPVDKGGDYILYGSFFRIEHASSHKWLKVNINERVVDSRTDKEEVIKEYIKSINYPITFDKFFYENVVLFKPVDQKKIDELNYVNSLYAILSEFIDKVNFSKKKKKLHFLSTKS